jgi:hypothetical protein
MPLLAERQNRPCAGWEVLVSGVRLVETTISGMTVMTKAAAGASPRFSPDIDIYRLG